MDNDPHARPSPASRLFDLDLAHFMPAASIARHLYPFHWQGAAMPNSRIDRESSPPDRRARVNSPQCKIDGRGSEGRTVRRPICILPRLGGSVTHRPWQLSAAPRPISHPKCAPAADAESVQN
jgi:hypothetical protein